jgi:hypothetical protein
VGCTAGEEMEPGEVHVATIQHVERAGFGDQHIEHMHIVSRCIGDVQEGGDVAAQVEQRVQLHPTLGAAEACPREDREAEIDGGGVERIHGLLQLQIEGVARVKATCLADQHLSELGEDPPDPLLVGIGQGTPGDSAADAHVVELLRHGTEADLDVAQALPIGELREGHREVLVPAREAAEPMVAAVSLHAAGERFVRNEAHELREDGASLVHHPLRCEVSQQNG